MSFLINILSHLLEWLMKLFFLFIIIAIVGKFTMPYMQNLSIVVMYFLNLSIYKILPYSSLLFMKQVFILGLTLRITLWISGHKFFKEEKDSPEMIEGMKQGRANYRSIQAGAAPGFTSKDI